MQKKKRSALANWSIAVGTGAVVIGAGLYLGLDAAMQHNAIARAQLDSPQTMPLVDGAQESYETAAELGTGVAPPPDTTSEIYDAGVADDNQIVEQPVSDELAETELSGYDDEQSPVDESADLQPQRERPESTDESQPAQKRSIQRAPAPAPAAAVRLANGEEFMVPPDKRIDQFLASQDGSRMDSYIEQVYNRGPAQEPTYPSRPTN